MHAYTCVYVHKKNKIICIDKSLFTMYIYARGHTQ